MEKKMNQRILLWLCVYSDIIVTYLFSAIFLYVIVIKTLKLELSLAASYFFWLLLGIFIGFKVALIVVNYLKKNRV